VFSTLSETLLHLWSRSADDNDIVDSDTKKKTVEDKAVFFSPVRAQFKAAETQSELWQRTDTANRITFTTNAVSG